MMASVLKRVLDVCLASTEAEHRVAIADFRCPLYQDRRPGDRQEAANVRSFDFEKCGSADNGRR